ncbi:MAG: biotin--[acetyl-CoA-carboxylase] ligase [Desulfobacteraceae bacterium]
MEPEAESAIPDKLKSVKHLQPVIQPSVTRSWIRCGSSSLPLYATESCTSSMDVAWRLCSQASFPEWASVVAAVQSSGRGQFGRTWHSPPGNLYATVRIQRPGQDWNDLVPLLLAEAMRCVLNRLGVATAIKWPNDLIVAGKKVGGILLETRSDVVMAGLGLNLVSAPRPGELRHPMAPTAGYLGEFGLRLAPLEVWIRFIHEARRQIRDARVDGDPRRFVGNLGAHLA